VSQEMPACEPVAVEGWLKQQLGRQQASKAFTVLRVHQLRRHNAGGDLSKTITYKVVLGDSGQRDIVLRNKASALRGTAYTIDVCLTRQQLASKRALMPAAKRAAQQGQRVRWKYDRLYIDGKEHLSQPGSRQQQQGAGMPTNPSPANGSSPAPTTTHQVPDNAPEEGEWQVASSRKQQRRQQQRRQRQQQARVSPAGADSPPPAPAAMPEAAHDDSCAGGSSATATSGPPSPASKPAGKPSIDGRGAGRGAAAKRPSKKPQRSYAAAAATAAGQGKENKGSGSGGSGAAKGASRAPLAPLAPPANSGGAQHRGGSQHGQQPQRPSTTPTSPARA
jgi:hypothetical protein